MGYKFFDDDYDDFLAHHQIKGAKHGVRRWQNPDGSWTPEGRLRYGKGGRPRGSYKDSNNINPIGSNTPGVYKKSDVVFISGKVSYDRRIPKRVQNELDACMKADAKIIVGDAPGADTRVQDYLAEKKYKNVEVYTTDAKVRNNVGNWKVKKISSNGYTDEREVRRQKDIAMTNAATRGFAISSDDDRPESATSLNIQRMKDQGKQIDLYDFKKGQYYVDKEGGCNRLVNELNTEWDYGVLYKGKHVTDTSDFNWTEYRTTPIDTLKKEKCGVCWDFVNYQHDMLKNLGIRDKSYMFTMKKSEMPDDLVTHTFTMYEVDGKKYWLESAMWPKRGIHEVKSYKDVIKEIKDNYKVKDADYSLFEYNPDGLDKGLTDQEYFKAATQKLVYDHKKNELKHYGIPRMRKGHRRWQTKDGSRTAEGHKRYDNRKTQYIDKLMAQGYPQKQAVAIAYRLVARDEGRGDTGSIKLKNKFNEDGKRLSLQSFLEQQVADEGLEGRRAAAQVRYRQRVLKEKGADFIAEYMESGGENYEW